jgi:histidine triad (HIT) family protein
MIEDCVFCKIAREELPCYKVWENAGYLAFLDINPFCVGHTVVIPKKHVRWVWDVDDFEGYMRAVEEVVGVLKKVFETDCVQAAVIGEDVFHAHVNLYPRTERDGLGAPLSAPMEKKVDLDEVFEKFDKILLLKND